MLSDACRNPEEWKPVACRVRTAVEQLLADKPALMKGAVFMARLEGILAAERGSGPVS